MESVPYPTTADDFGGRGRQDGPINPNAPLPPSPASRSKRPTTSRTPRTKLNDFLQAERRGGVYNLHGNVGFGPDIATQAASTAVIRRLVPERCPRRRG